MKYILKTLTWVIFFIPCIYLAMVWNRMPATVPVHFNLEGEADDYGSKQSFAYLIIGLTVLNIVVYLLLCNIHRIDPKRNAADNKERMKRIALTTSLFLSVVFTMIIYTSMQADPSSMSKLVLVAMGPFFSLLGNYMYNIKPNYFAGIRVPWTLEDPENWKLTHQLAGRLWFGGGILMFIVALFCNSVEAAGIAMFIIMVPLIFIPIIYSYKLYISKKKFQQH